jgi:hypothetical protein
MTKIGTFTVLEIKQQLAEMMILEEQLWDSLYGDTRSGQAIQDESAREYAGVGRGIQYLKQCLGRIDPDALTIMLTADGFRPNGRTPISASMHGVAKQVLGMLKRNGHDVSRAFNDSEHSQLYIHAPADLRDALQEAITELNLVGRIEVERTPRIGDLFNWNMAHKFLDANPVETV